MLGLLLRLLPFWVREPLFILVGSVFGVRIMYLAAHEQNWAAAGIGTAFLVFTAVRVHTVVRALRARRSPDQPAPAGGTVPQPLPQPPPGLPATPKKEPNAWGQAFAAVALFGALAAAVWVAPHMTADGDDNTPAPASCSGSEHGKLPKAYARTPKAATGDELCEALNRPDLAELMGTPDERATSATGTSGTSALTNGKVAEPEAQVEFDTYTVNLSATYNKLSVAQYVKMMKTGGENNRTDTILGRPAVFSSDPTMKIEINLGGKDSSGPVEAGPLARTLTVALDRKDAGGYYDITVWSESGALPDDGVLLDIAEEVLPTIPGRAAR
ncbi:hypothetical protein AMK09_35860 [Streptomyces sp. CB02488]|uniref:DUF6215 domain-containing protein n=1 Tax=Streptomyces sp. CB02488 TaxID=1703920 RepID=UPI00093B52DB|nr:DUF6215 domain-containing protein [Streptomyces sp. CB02488]OKK07460.1 hypothetical protein AMK09_35860 [Streptomyces sp. CB02488]